MNRRLRACLLALCAALLATPTLASGLPPAPYYITYESLSPGRIAVADVNGDGHVDVVAAVGGASQLNVRLGDGSGRFGPATPYALPAPAADVAVADLDGDGLLDLVATGPGAAVSFFPGTAPGVFGARSDWGAGFSVLSSLAVGDLDGDGRRDVVVTDPAMSQAIVARQVVPRVFLTGSSPLAGIGPESPALADMNADGKLDLLVVTTNQGGVVIANGRGDATFDPPSVFTALTNPIALALGDLNA